MGRLEAFIMCLCEVLLLKIKAELGWRGRCKEDSWSYVLGVGNKQKLGNSSKTEWCEIPKSVGANP